MIKLIAMTKVGQIARSVGFEGFNSSELKVVRTYPMGVNVDEHGRKFVQTPNGRIY